MKVAIITFSPSGNTSKIGRLLKDELEKLGGVVAFHDITKNEDIFDKGDYHEYLKSNVKQHDVLCLGAPVYEHHYPEAMLGLIEALPAPCESWGRYVLPFVTYGRICSGSALEKAAVLLHRSGRTVVSGLKIATPHTMLETLLGREIGTSSSEDGINRLVSITAKRILSVKGMDSFSDQGMSLRYQGFAIRMLDNTILSPRIKFLNLLPSIRIDANKCSRCQVCIRKCPTNHLCIGEDGSLRENQESSCIHCFNCIKYCPHNAIGQSKNIKFVEMFVQLLTKGGFENPQNGIYPGC